MTTAQQTIAPKKHFFADQPLFSEWGTLRQSWESVGGAVVSGALCGYAVGVNEWFYLASVLVTFLGGFPTGAQHRTLRGALARAFVGGFFWAGTMILVHLATGGEPTATLPDPIVWFLLYGIVPSCIAGMTSWFLADRRRRRG